MSGVPFAIVGILIVGSEFFLDAAGHGERFGVGFASIAKKSPDEIQLGKKSIELPMLKTTTLEVPSLLKY